MRRGLRCFLFLIFLIFNLIVFELILFLLNHAFLVFILIIGRG